MFVAYTLPSNVLGLVDAMFVVVEVDEGLRQAFSVL